MGVNGEISVVLCWKQLTLRKTSLKNNYGQKVNDLSYQDRLLKNYNYAASALEREVEI